MVCTFILPNNLTFIKYIVKLGKNCLIYFYGLLKTYFRVRNKHTPTLINFLTFFQGLLPYSRLHRAYFSSMNIRYKWGYAYSFCQIFHVLRLFKGLRLFQTLEYHFSLIYIVFNCEACPGSQWCLDIGEREKKYPMFE